MRTHYNILWYCMLCILLCNCSHTKKTLFAVNEADSVFLIVGSYSKAQDEGIKVFSFNQQTGGFTYRNGCSGIANPSFLCTSKDGGRIYAVSEVGGPDAAAHSLTFRADDASLTWTGSSPTHGSAPCHIALSPSENFLYTANYMGGSISEFPLTAEGEIGKGRALPFTGKSIVAARQDKPYLHAVYFTPDNRCLLANDLGTDRVHCFPITGRNDSIRFSTLKDIHIKAGAGPRHLCFHPKGHRAYLLGELSGEIYVLSHENGRWKTIQTILADSLHAGGSADIHCSPDGKFLYASHRLKGDGLSIMRIHPESGMLERIGYQPTGLHPRNFALTPNGQFLLVACKDDNVIEVYRRNTKTGLLSDTGKRINMPQPVCLRFLGEETQKIWQEKVR